MPRTTPLTCQLLHLRRCTYHQQPAYLGSGVGAVYTLGDSGFKVSGNYVAANGDNSTMGGIGTDETISTSACTLYEGEIFDGNLLAQAGYSYERNAALATGTTGNS